MSFTPTPEQSAIIGAPLERQCIVACAGSGKTATAVRRLCEIRCQMAASRGYALLLSFSNVAVETFRSQYAALARAQPGLSPRVRIETMDSFITSQILRPHAGRTMQAKRPPFLVFGSEAFLSGFTWYDGQRPRMTRELAISVTETGELRYVMKDKGMTTPVPNADAKRLIDRLGSVGCYTHEIGRYWAIRTLVEQPRLSQVLACRFPQIVVDEAQDIGSMHGTLLELLASDGACVSLIGDPNQAIYEFADADGSFLTVYGTQPGIATYPLSVNRRSLAPIVAAANGLAGTSSTSVRQAGSQHHGTYFVRYDARNIQAAIGIFKAILQASGYAETQAAVLCRASAMVRRLSGADANDGQGATAHFVRAAVSRDRGGNIARAFDELCMGVLRLLAAPPDDLRDALMRGTAQPSVDLVQLRRRLWRFLRCVDSGLPSSALKGSSTWLPRLKTRVDLLLADIESGVGLARSSTWTSKVTKAKLSDDALWPPDLATVGRHRIRTDTVHKAKGESIDAVMYLARTEDITALLSGTASEEGRIGYVALTRARDLFVLGVPATAKPALVGKLELAGFARWTL